MKSRVLAEMRALGPRPSWWRPFKRRRWQRQYRALAILYLSLAFEEQVRAIRIYEDVIGTEDVLGNIRLDHDSESAPVWLDDVYSLVAKSLPDDAVDILFQRFDEMFSRSEFEACDGVLRAIDLGRLDTNLLVALLSITRPASAKLGARIDTLRDVEKELRKRSPDRAERLLSGLR